MPVLKDIEILDTQTYHNGLGYKATAYISEENDLGADCFHFRVITFNDLTQIIKDKRIFYGRATIFVDELNLDLVRKEIELILKDCIRTTWEEVAGAINRHLSWEYDNIQYETLDETLKRLNLNE
ncbi:Imm8 family immunity protein [Bacillus sp. FJAT-27245]|uniref:Imm8 family immunity protein n=1 Tax=Bacillus sp. FJAT-27245 TaxID=1684144 RepID=UPI001E2D5395|nr:Imm8 family immunity protein [Bacillus sp. FJAT-27245]